LQSRVILEHGLTVDFAPLRAKSVNEDLALRDFTINSLAFPLHQDFATATVLDPLEGIQHVEQRLLQTCSEQSFIDDPLRMLKGIRHAASLGMQLTEETFLQVRRHATLIGQVAGERIREELGQIFSADQCFAGIKLLMESGLLAAMFGPPGSSWNESTALKALLACEQQMSLAGLQVPRTDEFQQGSEPYSHHTLFLLAALFNCYQPQNLPNLLHLRLRLSRRQQKLLLALQQQPADDWFSSVTGSLSGRQQALFVEQLGYAPDEQLLYLAIRPNDLTYPRALELRQSFIAHQRLGRVPDLLGGELIRELLTGDAGLQIGLWQKRLKVAEMTGKISNSDEALKFLKEKISI